MALTTCKVCGGKMSDRATECPHCGATQEQQQELKAKERKNYIWLVVAAILWLGALFIIVDTLIGERWSRICGDLPNGGFEWFRCEMNLLVAPFIVAAIIAVIGFLICHKSKKTILIGSFSSLVGIAILSGIVYFLSDTYNYKEDQYSDWYRDNVIFDFSNEENFAELINGTAWVDNNGEAAFVFKDNKVYLAAAKKGGGWLIGEGTYSKRDYQSALELKNIYIDNTTYNGTFRSRRCELTSWRGSLEMNNFHRLHKSDLKRYGFNENIINMVTEVPDEVNSGRMSSSISDDNPNSITIAQDSKGNYLVKSIKRVSEGKVREVYTFQYNSKGEISKIEHIGGAPYRNVITRDGKNITFSQYTKDGNQVNDDKCTFTVNDLGQIAISSIEGSNVKNEYYYQNGKLVRGEYHSYDTNNNKNDLGNFGVSKYDYPDGNIWATSTLCFVMENGDLDYNEYKPLAVDVEYSDIANNINVELSALYFNYAPWNSTADNLAFLSGWMNMRSSRLLYKYGETYRRTHIDYTLDNYNRPIEAKCVADIPDAKYADNFEYQIEYVDAN